MPNGRISNGLLDGYSGGALLPSGRGSAIDSVQWGNDYAGNPIINKAKAVISGLLGEEAGSVMDGTAQSNQSAQAAGLLGNALTAIPGKAIAAALAPLATMAAVSKAAQMRGVTTEAGRLARAFKDQAGAISGTRSAPRAVAKKPVDDALALQQGYEEWFHGHAGKPYDMIDPKQAGSITGTIPSQVAMFASKSPNDAMEFAANAAANTGEKPNVMRLGVLQDKQKVVTWPESFPPVRSNNGQRLLAGILMDAEDEGMKSVRIKGISDTVSGKPSDSDVLAILYKNGLGTARDMDRAKFDPTKLGVPGLTFGLGGLELAPFLYQADSNQKGI